jgi:hypothetical protein
LLHISKDFIGVSLNEVTTIGAHHGTIGTILSVNHLPAFLFSRDKKLIIQKKLAEK